jgi:3-oxoacyl-[acyl-carrier protein] reductase
MSAPLVGRVALVTGASQGLGRAIALALAEGGASICIHHAVHAGQAAEDVVGLIKEAGGKACTAGGDLRDPSTAPGAVNEAVERLGGLDILVNNAGVSTEASITELTLEEWNATIAVNLTAVFLMTKAALPVMAKRGWGRIISISSNIGHRGAANLAHYAAAKAGVMAFTRCLALEAAPLGVIATAIAPGPIDTEMFRRSSEALRTERLSEIPLGRPAAIEEIVPTVLLLASESGGFYVGQTLNPNGGHIML